jgi:hypothetical protein
MKSTGGNMSEVMDRLLREEKEAEAMMYGEEPVEEQAQATEEPDEDDAQEELDHSEESVEASEEPETTEKPQRVNWKKRFIGYKDSTDITIRDLRHDNASYRVQISDLKDEIESLRKQLYELEKKKEPVTDPFEGVFTQEDIDLLGPEAIEAMKKVALAQRKEPAPDPRIERLEREAKENRERERERAKREAEKSDAEQKEYLRNKLEELIPNFEKIDEDPGFAKYLNEVDPLSRKVRMDLFANSVNTLDVAGVARFYKEFSGKSKESFMDDFITPTGDGATDSAPERTGKKIHRLADYEQFMDDITKGKYRGREKEARKLELMYDKAYQEGRLVE